MQIERIIHFQTLEILWTNIKSAKTKWSSTFGLQLETGNSPFNGFYGSRKSLDEDELDQEEILYIFMLLLEDLSFGTMILERARTCAEKSTKTQVF